MKSVEKIIINEKGELSTATIEQCTKLKRLLISWNIIQNDYRHIENEIIKTARTLFSMGYTKEQINDFLGQDYTHTWQTLDEN